ncbi:hypothetical protein DFH94DRAFT_679781 [Russula ochroleuca]|uniref:Uncharacterized protein n=1 Tax=Russula ochroleuca TaxID=152965 RepID=A0A9P5TDB3_9AGAM|nr:hypothetical protein DFH94DRAFT_679781 [Russula ochroleuca]
MYISVVRRTERWKYLSCQEHTQTTDRRRGSHEIKAVVDGSTIDHKRGDQRSDSYRTFITSVQTDRGYSTPSQADAADRVGGGSYSRIVFAMLDPTIGARKFIMLPGTEEESAVHYKKASERKPKKFIVGAINLCGARKTYGKYITYFFTQQCRAGSDEKKDGCGWMDAVVDHIKQKKTDGRAGIRGSERGARKRTHMFGKGDYKPRGDSTTPYPITSPQGRKLGPALSESCDKDGWRSGSQWGFVSLSKGDAETDRQDESRSVEQWHGCTLVLVLCPLDEGKAQQCDRMRTLRCDLYTREIADTAPHMTQTKTYGAVEENVRIDEPHGAHMSEILHTSTKRIHLKRGNGATQGGSGAGRGGARIGRKTSQHTVMTGWIVADDENGSVGGSGRPSACIESLWGGMIDLVTSNELAGYYASRYGHCTVD